MGNDNNGNNGKINLSNLFDLRKIGSILGFNTQNRNQGMNPLASLGRIFGGNTGNNTNISENELY